MIVAKIPIFILTLFLIFCTPSILSAKKLITPLSYTINHFPSQNIDSKGQDYSISSTVLNVESNFGYPISKKIILIGGFTYKKIWNDFETINNDIRPEFNQALDGQVTRQQTFGVSAGALYTLENNDKIMFRINPSFNSNSGRGSYLNLMFNAMYMPKEEVHSTFHWTAGFGIIYTKSSIIPIPLCLMQYEFSDFNLDVILPYKIDFNYNIANNLQIGSRFMVSSDGYYLKSSKDMLFAAGNAKVSNMKLLVGPMLSWRLHDWVALECGYLYSVYSEILSDEFDKIDVEVEKKFNFSFGLKMIIPDGFFKKNNP